MKTFSTIEDEINKARLRIYEETKGMSAAERAERVNKIGETSARKYGFTVSAGTQARKTAE